MPNVNLPTGVNLYYETHGQGEPLVLGTVDGIFRRSLEAVATAAGRLDEPDFARSARLRPLGGERSKFTPSIRWPTTSSPCSII